MTTKKNQTTVIIAIGCVLIGAYLVFDYLKNNKKPLADSNTSITPKASLINKDKVLAKGSKGAEVALLQNTLGSLVIDGDFGEKTEKRLLQVKGVSKITLNELNKK